MRGPLGHGIPFARNWVGAVASRQAGAIPVLPARGQEVTDFFSEECNVYYFRFRVDCMLLQGNAASPCCFQ